MKVSDIGPPSAKIVLIGEAPGKNEEAKGIPFCGQSGTLLKHMLSHSGIDFNECYVTNVVNERPPGNDFGYMYETKSRTVPTDRLQTYWYQLRDKIRKLHPVVVVCLGAEPLRALTGKRSIEAWRGCVTKFDNIKVVPTYHPAAVLRSYGLHAISEIDLAKACRESTHTEHNYTPPDMILQPTLQDVRRYMADIKNSSVYPRVSFDIETCGEQVRCIGIARGRSTQPETICIPFIRFPSSGMVTPGNNRIINISGSTSSSCTSYWRIDEEVVVLQLLAELLESTVVQKVGQNSISFDQPLIEKNLHITVNNHYMDTMHAFHTLYLEFPKSLNFLTSIYTDYPNYWTGKVTEDDLSEWKYCSYDAAVTLIASYRIDEELKADPEHNIYNKYVHDLAFSLARVQERGVLVDKDKRTTMSADCQVKIDHYRQQVCDIAKHEINLDSPVQVKRLLYEELRFPTVYNKQGKSSVDEASLNSLIKKYPDEKVLNLILDYRKVRVLNSTFLQSEVDPDGYMRTNYNPSGTETGRISSSKNIITKRGMNLQNVPKNIRDLFIADKDRVFVKCDLSQAETRVVSEILYRCGDSTLKDKYTDKNFDIHTWIASEIYKKPEADVTNVDRQLGKLVNHSGNYGAGPRVLQTQAHKYGVDNVTYDVSKFLLEARHRAIPGLKEWWKDVERQLTRTRTIVTCLGRKRIFFGRLDQGTFRDAYAFEPQSTIGDVTNIGLVRLEKLLPSEAFIVLQVHDEIVVSCLEEQQFEVAECMKKAFVIPLFINESPILIPLDISVGNNWRDGEVIL